MNAARGGVGKTAVIGAKGRELKQVKAKHLDKYVTEFADRHNIRIETTINQMQRVFRGMVSNTD